MAQQLNPESANQTSNVKAREDAIKEALEQLYQEDLAIEAIIEADVKDHREQKRDIKKRMREGYEISTKLLNARYATYKIERKATDNKDDTVADMLRELWEACPPGSHVDLVDALQGAAE